MDATPADRTPVHLLTGFLGSGKTTLLRHILSDPAFANTAVIINEFGETGLDHLLVREVAEDIALLASGCVCCTVRDDLITVLGDLEAAEARGDIPRLSRIVLETTGLADPGPILRTLMAEGKRFAAGLVLTTVDAVNGAATIDRFPEAAAQIALADRIVLTKTDLAEAPEVRLRALNAQAPILRSCVAAMPSPSVLFEPCDERIAPVPHDHAHSHGIATFTVHPQAPVDWDKFVDWLQLLLLNRGNSILRIKGLLAVAGEPRPVVIQGVQHMVHAPHYLDTWPEGARPWLVFIARHLSAGAIERSLRSTYADQFPSS